MSDAGYVVAVKPSARRVSAAVGEWVNREGPRRRFESKALAREWARAASTTRATVWVQDARPGDDARADGYLVAARRRTAASGGDTDGQTAIGRF